MKTIYKTEVSYTDRFGVPCQSEFYFDNKEQRNEFLQIIDDGELAGALVMNFGVNRLYGSAQDAINALVNLKEN